MQLTANLVTEVLRLGGSVYLSDADIFVRGDGYGGVIATPSEKGPASPEAYDLCGRLNSLENVRYYMENPQTMESVYAPECFQIFYRGESVTQQPMHISYLFQGVLPVLQAVSGYAELLDLADVSVVFSEQLAAEPVVSMYSLFHTHIHNGGRTVFAVMDTVGAETMSFKAMISCSPSHLLCELKNIAAPNKAFDLYTLVASQNGMYNRTTIIFGEGLETCSEAVESFCYQFANVNQHCYSVGIADSSLRLHGGETLSPSGWNLALTFNKGYDGFSLSSDVCSKENWLEEGFADINKDVANFIDEQFRNGLGGMVTNWVEKFIPAEIQERFRQREGSGIPEEILIESSDGKFLSLSYILRAGQSAEILKQNIGQALQEISNAFKPIRYHVGSEVFRK